MNKTIAIYQNALIDIDDHLRYPRLYPQPNKFFATFVLYEETTRPISNLFRLTTTRRYDIFGEEQDKSFFMYRAKKTDIYIHLIAPWLLGADLKFLDARLKEERQKICPENDFIYKDYEELQISTTR